VSSLAALAVQAGCTPGLTCGPGTHEEVGTCVPDGADTDDTGSTSTTDTGPTGGAHDWLVCDRGGDFTSVQAAVDAAAAGEVIALCPGTYFERLEIEQDVTLTSLRGPDVTFLDGDLAGTLITVEGASLTLDGLTLQRGDSDVQAGGVFAVDAELTIRGSVLREHQSHQGGPVIQATGGSLELTDCLLDENIGTSYAIWLDGTETLVRHVVDRNYESYVYDRGGGFLVVAQAAAEVWNTIVHDSRTGHAAFSASTEGTLWVSNVVVEVDWESRGFSGTGLTLQNSIAVGDGTGGLGVWVTEGSTSADYSLFHGLNCMAAKNGESCIDPGVGNLTGDPRFVDADAGDFLLDEFSPAVDAGNPGEAFNDPDGSRNDMGAFGGPYGDWTPRR